jgi:hypothetical protein
MCKVFEDTLNRHRAGGVTQVVRCLPSKQKALSKKPPALPKKKKKKKDIEWPKSMLKMLNIFTHQENTN